MNRKKRLMAIIIIVLTTSLISAQEKAEDISIGHSLKITSSILGEDRDILIYLPEGYNESEKKYPVLYMLDGETHFHHGSGIVQFLSANDRIPQCIVVAIPNTNRGRDFSLPTGIEEANRGGADNFLDFLQDELMPLIDLKYRTHPYSILFGHSSTGMFSVYTFVERPHLFNANIAASPSLQERNGFVVEKAKKLLTKESTKNRALYITLGNEPSFVESIENFTTILKGFYDTGLEWKYEIMLKEDHGSVVHKSIYQGLEFVFSGLQISAEEAKDLSSIQNYYSSLSEKFGFKITPPELLLNRLAYQVFLKKEFAHAIEILKANVSLYPNSDNVYDSLGEAYEGTGKLELAVKNYKIALEKGQKSKSRNVALYKRNLERVQALIK